MVNLFNACTNAIFKEGASNINCLINFWGALSHKIYFYYK